jgi:hypothetical protein
MALGWPVLAWRQAAPGSAVRRRAACFAIASAWLVLVGGCLALGVSLIWHPANMLALALAYGCAGALALYAFRLPSLWLLIPVGLSCMIAWLVLGLVPAMAGGEYDALDVPVGDGMTCRSSYSQAFLGPMIRDFSLYRRYAVLDHKAASWGYDDDAGAPMLTPPPPFAAAFDTCQRRADAMLALKREAEQLRSPRPAPPAPSTATPRTTQTPPAPPPASH